MGWTRFKVGGCVRDRLLGRKSKDVDWVVVGASVEEMTALGYQAVGKDFPVFLHPQSREEHALARTERKSGRGYGGFTVDASPEVTLEEDLGRRDLTINAIAEASDGQLIDPFQGQKDLAAGVLRHVGPAFVEDPLRVLRVARFAAKLGFRVAPETQELLSQMASGGELDTLTPERVWAETERALATDHPAEFFRVLRSVGALSHVFPELAELEGVEQPEKYHPEGCALNHSLLALERAGEGSKDVLVRFGTLVHDIGKAATPKDLWPRHHGHEQAGVPRVRSLCDRLKAPNRFLRFGMLAAEWHTHFRDGLNLRAGTLASLLKRFKVRHDLEDFERFLAVGTADLRGRTGCEQEPLPQLEYLRQVAIAVRSVEVDSTLSGKAVAERLHQDQCSAIKRVPKPAP